MPIHSRGQSAKNGRVVESGMYLRLPCIQRDVGCNHHGSASVCVREPHNTEDLIMSRIATLYVFLIFIEENILGVSFL